MLIHGVGASARVWAPVTPDLAARHAVSAIDLPGHGGRPPLPGTPSAAGFADAVEELLPPGRSHLAGNSIGATLALELARRGRALSVSAFAPVGLGTPAEDRRTRRRLVLLRALAPFTRPLARPLAATAVGRTLLYGLSASRPWRVEPAAMVEIVRAAAGSEGFREALDAFLGDAPAGLEAIDCPVTIAWGSADRLVPARLAARGRERVPGCEVRELRGLGHVPMADDPGAVAATILATTAATERVAA